MKRFSSFTTLYVLFLFTLNISCYRPSQETINPSHSESVVLTAKKVDIQSAQLWFESEVSNAKAKKGILSFSPDWKKEIKQINTAKGKVLLVPVNFKGTRVSQRGRNDYWHRLALQFNKDGSVSSGEVLLISQDYTSMAQLPLENVIVQFENNQKIKNFNGYIQKVNLLNEPVATFQYVGGNIFSSNSKLIAASSNGNPIPNGRRSTVCTEYWWVTTYSDGRETWVYMYTQCVSDQDDAGDSGGSGSSGDSNNPPPSQETEPKVGLNEKNHECNTIKQMWNSSLGTNPDGSKYPLIERAALITDRGLLVMPTSGRRAVSHMENGSLVYTPTGDAVSNSANISYLDLLGGFLQDPNTGGLLYRTFEGETYKVLGNIHTHPWTSIGNPQLPSSDDRGDKACRDYGVPMYIMGAEGITEYNNDGSLGVRWTPLQVSGCNSWIF